MCYCVSTSEEIAMFSTMRVIVSRLLYFLLLNAVKKSWRYLTSVIWYMNPSIIWKHLLHFFAYVKPYFILFNLLVIDVLYANPGSCLLQRLFSLHLWENVIVSIAPIYFPVVSNRTLYCIVKIYIAPSKALVQEKLRHWTQKLGTFGIDCLELTGDNEYYNVKSMQDADIILTTPEVVS